MVDLYLILIEKVRKKEKGTPLTESPPGGLQSKLDARFIWKESDSTLVEVRRIVVTVIR